MAFSEALAPAYLPPWAHSYPCVHEALKFVDRKAAPEPLRPVPEAEALRLIDAAQLAGMAVIVAAVLEAMKRLQSGANLQAIEAGIALGNVELVLSAVPWYELSAQLSSITPALEASMRAGYRAGHLMLPGRGAGVELSRVALRARTADWIRTNTAELVTEVTEQTRGALRETVLRSFRGPLSFRRTAKQVRSMVGLNVPQARAFNRYIDGLLEDTELSAAEIQRRINVRHRKLLNYRARMIGATEGQAAGNAGLGEYWSQAGAEGKLDTGRYVQEWVVRPVGACVICLELDKHTAAVGQLFYSPRLGVELSGPTAHPFCYCGKRLQELGRVAEGFQPGVLRALAA